MKKVSTLVKTGCVFSIISLILGTMWTVLKISVTSDLMEITGMEITGSKNVVSISMKTRYYLEYPILSSCFIAIISLLFIYFYIMIFQGKVSNQNKILLGILGIIVWSMVVDISLLNLLGGLFIIFGKYEDIEL